MRASIRLKLFFTLLAAIFAVVLVMGLLVQWSFDRGFRRYVEALETVRIERFEEELTTEYAATGSWDFLQANPGLWQQLFFSTAPFREPDASRPDRTERRPRRGERRGARPDAPPPDSLEARVFLLDAEQQPVAGRQTNRELATLRPLNREGRTIGYLGLLPPRKLIDQRQLRFIQEQKRAFLFIGLALACGAALLSLPLARSLVRRIVVLAEGTHHLASGRFDSHIHDDSNDELGQLGRDFNRLAATLERNEVARRQWVADTSHELRTPVTILRGEIEALRDGVRPITPEALGSLHNETLRLQRLIEDLHQLALADVGALSCRKEPLELGEILQALCDDYMAAFAAQGLTLKLTLPPEPLPLAADPVRLRQLFSNLLENSLKYTERSGCSELSARSEGGNLVIDLRDSAPGVPTAALPQLFERFYRVEGSRNRASGGAGLGLAICRVIVTAHGGTIVVRPSPLGGLWVRVTLPGQRRQQS